MNSKLKLVGALTLACVTLNGISALAAENPTEPAANVLRASVNSRDGTVQFTGYDSAQKSCGLPLSIQQGRIPGILESTGDKTLLDPKEASFASKLTYGVTLGFGAFLWVIEGSSEEALSDDNLGSGKQLAKFMGVAALGSFAFDRGINRGLIPMLRMRAAKKALQKGMTSQSSFTMKHVDSCEILADIRKLAGPGAITEDRDPRVVNSPIAYTKPAEPVMSVISGKMRLDPGGDAAMAR